jgi:hypothetical protein
MPVRETRVKTRGFFPASPSWPFFCNAPQRRTCRVKSMRFEEVLSERSIISAGDAAGRAVRILRGARTCRFFIPGFVFIIALLGLLGTAGGQETADNVWTKPQAAVQAEIGIDSLQRRFYRPQFTFSWPLAVLGGSRAVFDVSYLQRINGRQQGAIDYWIFGGLETRVSETVSFEASLNHFCRHLTSVRNPYVLNLNELIGRVWIRAQGAELGIGYGPYIGGSRGYHDVMIFDFNLPRLLLPELALKSEWKWVNFRDINYEATLSVELARGTDIFIRAARHYAYPAAAYIGLRFRPGWGNDRIVDKIDLEAGAYPDFNRHKLQVNGGYRLIFLDRPDRRFFVDVDFRTPILSGAGFLAQFWPDHMLYDVSAQYEKPLPGGLFGAWYARYFVDMPVDRGLRFRSTLATGLILRNQPDFNRLDKPIRFEIAAGYDFVFAYDVRVRLGAQVKPRGWIPLGADFRMDANNERQTAEFKIFAVLGKEFEVRPFAGIRKISYLVGQPPPELFENKLTAGVAFLKWF